MAIEQESLTNNQYLREILKHLKNPPVNSSHEAIEDIKDKLNSLLTNPNIDIIADKIDKITDILDKYKDAPNIILNNNTQNNYIQNNYNIKLLHNDIITNTDNTIINKPNDNTNNIIHNNKPNRIIKRPINNTIGYNKPNKVIKPEENNEDIIKQIKEKWEHYCFLGGLHYQSCKPSCDNPKKCNVQARCKMDKLGLMNKEIKQYKTYQSLGIRGYC